MDRREQTTPASQESADQSKPMDQNDSDPGELLEKDLKEMSINKGLNPIDPTDMEDEVSNPPSIISSSESLSSLPHNSDSDSDINRTAIFIAGPKTAVPQTSTPKSTGKSTKSKPGKPKSLSSLLGKKPEKSTGSPTIQSYLITNNQTNKSTETPRPVTPNILDWFDAVELPDKDKKKDTGHTTSNSGVPSVKPLPQRESKKTSNKTTKRKRVGKDGACLVTAISEETASSSHDDDVMDVNKPTAINADSESTNDSGATPALVPWLLGDYSINQPLPQILVGKKVRFEPEPTNGESIYNTTQPAIINARPAPNHNSDSFQDTPGTFLNIPEEALSFFKRARGCLSSASRADARATRLDELINREIAAPWALRLEPIPAYLQSVTHELTDRQRKNALLLMKEATFSLRKTVSKMVTQGNENWNVVAKYLGDNDQELNKARLKMDSLIARDFEKEKTKIDAHNAVLIANPVQDKAIVENLRIRGYINPNKRQRPTSPPRGENNMNNPTNRAYDSDPTPGTSNSGARPKEPNPTYGQQRGRGKRRRSRSRSRSRSPNNGRGRFYDRSGPPTRGGQYRDNRRQPSNNQDNMVNPQAMAAIVRQVIQEMNQPTNQNQNQRGSRDNYRYWSITLYFTQVLDSLW